jgi:hypothetical protein
VQIIDTVKAASAMHEQLEFQCWFCGQGIERSDSGAVLIGVESLWRWESSFRKDNDPYQQVYSHKECAKSRLSGASMPLEPNIFGEDDVH